MALLLSSTAAAQSNVTNLNPGNQYVVAKPGPGSFELRWEDTQGPIQAWNLYYREGRIAQNSAAEMCAQRPNVVWYHTRTSRYANIQNLKELTYYTLLVEAEYRDQPKPSDNPQCDYVAHLELRTDAAPRELREVGTLQLYGNDRSIMVLGADWMRTPFLNVYYAIGTRSAEYMCKFRPNLRSWSRVPRGEKRWLDRLENYQLYTVMVVLRQDKSKCHYAIGTTGTLANAQRGAAVERINPLYRGIEKYPGDGAALLRWSRAKDHFRGILLRDKSVEAYYIYYQKAPAGNDFTAAKLCAQRPNRIRIDHQTHDRITEKLITGLGNGQQYVFLIEAKFKNPPAPSYCGYLYHGNLTPNKVQVLDYRLIPRQSASATPRDREILLEWNTQFSGRVRAWHIYTVEGVVKDLKRICTERKNAVKILSGSIDSYRVLHLQNDTPYTFVVEGQYDWELPAEVSPRCTVVYMVHATPVPN